jgi:hypothetical protein
MRYHTEESKYHGGNAEINQYRKEYSDNFLFPLGAKCNAPKNEINIE